MGMTDALGRPAAGAASNRQWADWLFKRSILKQLKFKRIRDHLGSVDGLTCLDLGSDNGVISYKLRQLGGEWTSADIDPRSVRAMRELVRNNVHRIDDRSIPFDGERFDVVVIVDLLEHVPDDAGFMGEVYRILKPGGALILNTPLVRDGWLMRLRERIGLSDDTHGHVRPGYSPESLRKLAGDGGFRLRQIGTHTRTIAKLLDTVMVWAISHLTKKPAREGIGHGLIVERQDVDKHRWAAGAFALIYPVIELTSKLDNLLFFDQGYMLIATAVKPDGSSPEPQ